MLENWEKALKAMWREERDPAAREWLRLLLRGDPKPRKAKRKPPRKRKET